MIIYEDVIPAEPVSPEAQAADGSWPVERPDMADRAPIVARMAADALVSFDTEGLLTEDALVRRGWPRDTVRRYGDPARDAFIRLLGARYRARVGAARAA